MTEELIVKNQTIRDYKQPEKNFLNLKFLEEIRKEKIDLIVLNF